MDNGDLTNQATATSERESDAAEGKPAKKKFLAPKISVPVDVLEATTFFQFTESGATN